MADYNEETQIPLVSVILPTYNRAKYLVRAVESVLAQTYIQFELIVIDDGSKDQTAEVVAGFNDGRIRYEFQTNKGRSCARNHGLRIARGKYIAFIDDDDLYLPEKLETQISYLEEHPEYDLVAGGAILIDNHGKQLRPWPIWYDTPQFDILTCVSNCCLFPTIVMVRSEAVKLNNIWFDKYLEQAEDTDFFIQMSLAGCTMSWDKRYVACYRQHESSSQHDANTLKQAELYILDKIYQPSTIPEPLIGQQGKLYASVFLSSACRNYLLGDFTLGASDYKQALTLDPELSKGNPPMALVSVAAFTNSFLVHEPELFLDIFWKKLPNGVRYSSTQRRQTMSMVYMTRVFRANADQDRMRFSWKDLFLGVLYDPRWLLNRGVLSIFFHNIRLTRIKPQR